MRRRNQDVTPEQLRAIHAMWREISPGISQSSEHGFGAAAERAARLAWISEIILRPLPTTRDLSRDEAQRVIERMKAELGQEFRPAPYRGRKKSKGKRQRVKVETASSWMAVKLAELAAELWPPPEDWRQRLRARLADPHYAVARVQDLSRRQAWNLKEELLQRIAVRNLKIDSRFSGDDAQSKPVSRTEIEAEKARLRANFFSKGAAAS